MIACRSRQPSAGQRADPYYHDQHLTMTYPYSKQAHGCRLVALSSLYRGGEHVSGTIEWDVAFATDVPRGPRHSVQTARDLRRLLRRAHLVSEAEAASRDNLSAQGH